MTNRTIRCLGVIPLLLIASRAAGQEGTSGMSELRASVAATNAAIRAACPHPTPEDRGALLKTELERSAAPWRGRASADDWHALGCARALLYAADAIAREGVLMSLGDSWHKGAIRALLEALALEPGHAASAELLGGLALAENFPAEMERIGPGLARAAGLGARGVMTLRGCAEFSRREGDPSAASRCGELALESGVDSTWQLVHLARLRFAAADTAEGQRLFHRAVAVARDSASWAPILWHLRWFLEPDEEAAWPSLPDSTRASWVRDRFATRDVRDGRAPGSRMAEHFARLETVESQFSIDVLTRRAARFDHAATSESRRVPEFVAMWWEPGLAAAPYYREFLRWEPRFDDRAVLYMRFGEPDKRIRWAGRDTVGTPARRNPRIFDPEGASLPGGGSTRLGPPGKPPLFPITNTREVWTYQVDGTQLLLNFESEEFDASAEATRFVTGVLGSYLCDVNTVRCNLTARSQMAYSKFYELGASEPSPLPPETLENLKTADREHIREATTRDDNSVRVEHPIATVASLSRVWDPRSGAQLAVVPYAVKVGDVARDEDSTGVTAMIALTLRQWDGAQGSWQETDAIRRLRLPARLRNSSHLTGYLVVPTTPTVSAWSLAATQGADRRGRAWQTDTRPLDSGPLVLSDLVLGAASQGQTWRTTSGTDVVLGPLGAFDKDEPLALYWQVRSSVAHEDATIRVALFRVTPREEREALALEFAARIGASLTELQRLIGIDRLDDGEYRLEVMVTGADGAVARRSARMLVD